MKKNVDFVLAIDQYLSRRGAQCPMSNNMDSVKDYATQNPKKTQTKKMSKSKTPRQSAAFRRAVNLDLLRTRLRELDSAVGQLCLSIPSSSSPTPGEDDPRLLVERCYKLLGGLDYLASNL